MNTEVRLYEQRFVPTLPYNQGPRVNNFVYLTSAFFSFLARVHSLPISTLCKAMFYSAGFGIEGTVREREPPNMVIAYEIRREREREIGDEKVDR